MGIKETKEQIQNDLICLLEDEVDQYDISTPDMDLQFTSESDQSFSVAPGDNEMSKGDKEFDSMYAKHLAKAPENEPKAAAKFIQDEDNSNLADSFCKQVILTNNDNNGLVSLQILKKENFGFEI